MLLYTHPHTYAHACTRTSIHKHAWTHTCIYYTHTHIHAYMHLYTHMHTDAYAHVCTIKTEVVYAFHLTKRQLSLQMDKQYAYS